MAVRLDSKPQGGFGSSEVSSGCLKIVGVGILAIIPVSLSNGKVERGSQPHLQHSRQADLRSFAAISMQEGYRAVGVPTSIRKPWQPKWPSRVRADARVKPFVMVNVLQAKCRYPPGKLADVTDLDLTHSEVLADT